MRVLLALLAGLLACAVQPQPDIDFHSTRWHMDQTVQNALATVQRVLEQDKRGPILRADQTPHRWGDKFLLVEWLTDTMVASVAEALARLGLSPAKSSQLREWVLGGESVYLSFEVQQRCDLIEERTREVESETTVERTHTSSSYWSSDHVDSVTTKVKRKVPEWLWRVDTSFNVSAVRGDGSDADARLLLMGRVGRQQLVTTTAHKPAQQLQRSAPASGQLAVDISWLLRALQPLPASEGADPDIHSSFSIDRDRPECATPRRNPEVISVLDEAAKLRSWAAAVQEYFHALARAAEVPPVELAAVQDIAPILPLLRGVGDEARVMEAVDTNQLLRHARKKLDFLGSQWQAVGASGQPLYPSGDQLEVFSQLEAKALLSLEYMQGALSQHSHALDFVEAMIDEQLVAAIGSEVQPKSFANYMTHHNRRLLRPRFAPKPFSVAIRRSERHSPEGTLSIERASGEPVYTLAATSEAPSAEMSFALDASTIVRFGGSRHLHAFLDHKFSTAAAEPLQLVARARQFSSMIVIVGKIIGEGALEPKHAAIVQNKDELTIPLELTALPTPKAFKRAVESLSPTQRRFAQAIRSMQLQSTLFGVLAIQVKPQLERALGLPADSLTKEIALTQQLMQLLLAHEIPTDLLSFSESAAQPELPRPVDAVRGHVAAMRTMLDEAKAREAAEREQQKQFDADARRAQAEAARAAEEMQIEVEPMMAYSMGSAVSTAARAAPQPQMMRAAFAAAPAPKHMKRRLASATIPQRSSAPPGQSEGGGVLRRDRQQRRQQPRSQQQSSDAQANPRNPDNAGQGVNGKRAGGGGRGGNAGGPGNVGTGGVDYTRVVAEMDDRIEQMDVDGALRPTIIDVGSLWRKKSRQGLLGPVETRSLHEGAQQDEKAKAFGLLDALTRAGGLALEDAELHVVVAATHQFDKSIMQTLIKDNIDPIERVERSTLVLASSVHQVQCKELVSAAELPRLSDSSPALFIEHARADATGEEEAA